MRAVLLSLHKYAGLSLGLLLAVIGLSGSLLVFDYALDETVTPAISNLPRAEKPASIERVLAAARDAAPGWAEPTRVEFARKPGSPHIVRFPVPEGGVGPLEVSVAPARGFGAGPSPSSTALGASASTTICTKRSASTACPYWRWWPFPASRCLFTIPWNA